MAPPRKSRSGRPAKGEESRKEEEKPSSRETRSGRLAKGEESARDEKKMGGDGLRSREVIELKGQVQQLSGRVDAGKQEESEVKPKVRNLELRDGGWRWKRGESSRGRGERGQ